jgi:hypothetical protein
MFTSIVHKMHPITVRGPFRGPFRALNHDGAQQCYTRSEYCVAVSSAAVPMRRSFSRSRPFSARAVLRTQRCARSSTGICSWRSLSSCANPHLRRPMRVGQWFTSSSRLLRLRRRGSVQTRPRRRRGHVLPCIRVHAGSFTAPSFIPSTIVWS